MSLLIQYALVLKSLVLVGLKKTLNILLYGSLILVISCSKIDSERNSLTNKLTNQNKRKAEDLICHDSLYSQAELYSELNKPDSALIYSLRAADGYLKRSEYACYTKMLYNAGANIIYSNPGLSEKYLNKALDTLIKRIPGQLETRLQIHMGLGVLYCVMGYPEKALLNYNKALEYTDSLILSNYSVPAYILNGIGDIYRYNYENPYEAINYYRKAYDLLQIDSTDQRRYLAESYYNLGTSSYLIGDLNNANMFFKNMLQLNNELPGPEKLNLYACYSMLGELATKNRNYKLANQYFQKSIRLISINDGLNCDLAFTYNAIATVFFENNKPDSSLFYYNKTLRVLNNDNPASQRILSDAYLGISDIMVHKKKMNEAFKYLRLSLEMSKQKHSYDRMFHSYVLKKIGEAHLACNEYDSAWKYFNESIFMGSTEINISKSNLPPAISIVNPYKQYETAGLAAMTRYKQYQNHKNGISLLQEAVKYFVYTDSLIVKSRLLITDKKSRLGFAQNAHQIYENALKVISALPESLNDYKNKLAFLFIERNKAVLLEEEVERSDFSDKDEEFGMLYNAEKNTFFTLVYLNKSLANEYTKPGLDSLKINYLLKQISNTTIKLDSIIENRKNMFPELSSFQMNFDIPEVSDIQSDLHDNELIIEYFYGAVDVYVLFISSKKKGFIPLCKNKVLTDLILEYSSSYYNIDSIYLKEGNARNYNKVATSVYKTLISDIISNVGETIDRIYIVPDGSIETIPFEALTSEIINSKNSFSMLPYLVFKYNISYQFSASLLKLGHSKKVRRFHKNKMLFLSPESISELPAQTKEIEIVRKFSNVKFFKGADATYNNFMKNAKDADIIHLSVHGKCIDTITKTYALVLKPDSGSDNNYLTSSDIISLKLKAGITVLSACYTGKGEYFKGEGTENVAKSFIAAGSKSVLITQERLADLTAAEIITKFYFWLGKGYNSTEALLKVKKDYLLHADNILAHPAFWSSVSIYGNDFRATKSCNYLIILIVILVIGVVSVTIYFNKRTF